MASSKRSRRAELLRLELSDQLRLFLDGHLDGVILMDWAMDHPFFEDAGGRDDLDEEDQKAIGLALGRILTMGPEEPLYQRSTREDLIESVRALSL